MKTINLRQLEKTQLAQVMVADLIGSDHVDEQFSDRFAARGLKPGFNFNERFAARGIKPTFGFGERFAARGGKTLSHKVPFAFGDWFTA